MAVFLKIISLMKNSGSSYSCFLLWLNLSKVRKILFSLGEAKSTSFDFRKYRRLISNVMPNLRVFLQFILLGRIFRVLIQHQRDL